MEKGKFIISLDFELHWGVFDSRSLDSYRQNILGARIAIPRVLDLFRDYEVHVTWATVGYLLCHSKEEILDFSPSIRPNYQNKLRSSYNLMDTIGNNEKEDPYHFAPSLVEQILNTPFQELATHTFSHFYCLEQQASEASLSDPDNKLAFRADLDAAIAIAKKYAYPPLSIVFPRNQFDSVDVEICGQKGIKAYRGNPHCWFYGPQKSGGDPHMVRAARLIDAYVPLRVAENVKISKSPDESPVNVPASRALRQFSQGTSALEKLKKERILSELRKAARTSSVYHLYWHPHNFGLNIDENLEFLKQILEELSHLRSEGLIESLTMGEIAVGK